MAKRKSQSQHDQMVREVYNHIISKGFIDVRADLKGLTQPELLYWESTGKGHIPDLSGIDGKNGNQLNIFEIETADSIFDQHTEGQWNLFAANARHYGKRFRVVVPKGSETWAKSRITQLGIQADVWTVG